MHPHFSPPLSHGYRASRSAGGELPFTPLFFLWIGLAFAAINFIAPSAFDTLPLDASGRDLVALGLAMPVFLGKRRLAQSFASALVAVSILSLYLDHLRTGIPHS